MQTKKWYNSKTVWFNVIAFVMLVLALPQFISVEPQAWIPYIALLSAIGNLFLRMFSTAAPIYAEPISPDSSVPQG